MSCAESDRPPCISDPVRERVAHMSPEAAKSSLSTRRRSASWRTAALIAVGSLARGRPDVAPTRPLTLGLVGALSQMRFRRRGRPRTVRTCDGAFDLLLDPSALAAPSTARGNVDTYA